RKSRSPWERPLPFVTSYQSPSGIVLLPLQTLPLGRGEAEFRLRLLDDHEPSPERHFLMGRSVQHERVLRSVYQLAPAPRLGAGGRRGGRWQSRNHFSKPRGSLSELSHRQRLGSSRGASSSRAVDLFIVHARRRNHSSSSTSYARFGASQRSTWFSGM